MHHDIQCPVCGKTFSCRSVVIYRHRQNNINTTCSRRCAKRTAGSLIDVQPVQIIFKNCEVCGKEFLANHYKNKRFCSPTHLVHCFICGETKAKSSKGMPRHYVCKKCVRQLHFLEKDLQSNNEISLCGFNYKNLPTEEELEYYNSLTTKEKSEYTSLKHFGTRHPSQSQEIKEKGWKTTIERYGGIGFASKEITERYHQTCLDKYGTEWASQSEEVKDKIKRVNLEKYGAENIYASEYGKQRIKETNLERYGVEYSWQADEVKAKIKQTNMKRYDSEYATQSPIVQEKTKRTNLEKYGVENVYQNENIKNKIRQKQESLYGGVGFQSDILREKIQQTNLKRYGNIVPMRATQDTLPKDSDINILPADKLFNTKKKNKSFGTSKIEKELVVKLEELYPDLETQYKSDVYPFTCDFYIPSLDLYIEYNGTWTHGGHFFDETNPDDLVTLELWKSKNTRYYNNAVHTWSIRDVLKLKTAIKNNLNYIAWFSEEQANDWINKMRVG